MAPLRRVETRILTQAEEVQRSKYLLCVSPARSPAAIASFLQPRALTDPRFEQLWKRLDVQFHLDDGRRLNDFPTVPPN